MSHLFEIPSGSFCPLLIITLHTELPAISALYIVNLNSL